MKPNMLKINIFLSVMVLLLAGCASEIIPVWTGNRNVPETHPSPAGFKISPYEAVQIVRRARRLSLKHIWHIYADGSNYYVVDSFLKSNTKTAKSGVIVDGQTGRIIENSDVRRMDDNKFEKFSICKAAKFLERVPLEGDRELFLYLSNEVLTVDILKKFEEELTNSGWQAKGKRPQTNKKYPSHEENVYERNGTKMSYWVGGSYGFQMIGITLPKPEAAGEE